MSSGDLIQATPDLLLLVKRDGIPVAYAGGGAVTELRGRPDSGTSGFVPSWSESTGALIRRLAQKAIADRAAVDARFEERGKQYEIRVHARGPDRALCVIRCALDGSDRDPLEATGEQRRSELDRRGFLRRFKESVALAALRERPLAVAVVYVDEIADIAQIVATKMSEQVMTTALSRLPADASDSTHDSPKWYLGQLAENLLALVVESANREAIEARVGGICASLRDPIVLGDAEFRLTPYAGVGILGVDASTPRILLDHARAAAAEARRAASRNVFFFSDTMQLRSLARIDLARELRQAIAQGDIRLRYTGRHDLRTGRRVAWVGYVRWIHPLRGEIRPVEFLRLAQTIGLATSLSRSVLARLAEDFASLAGQGPSDLRISLGALRDHVLHEDFVADLHRLLANGGVPPERLELRIAEKVFAARDATDFRLLHRLGVRFVVDEVGRGAGSLASLAKAPVWGLQLDRGWTHVLRGDEVARKVCRAGIAMATALGLAPIATGVDDEQQRDALLDLGCPYGLGDLYRGVDSSVSTPPRAIAGA